MLRITHNIGKVVKDAVKYNSTINKATRSALNKTIAQVRTQSGKEVRKVYNVKAADYKRNTSIQKATRTRLIAALTVTSRRLSLTRFKPRQNKRGVAVTIKKGNRRTIPSAFIAPGRGGKEQVFKRVGKARLPIRALKTIGYAEMVRNRKIDFEMMQFASAKFNVILAQRLDFYTNKQ